jgi:hypothetical protein
MYLIALNLFISEETIKHGSLHLFLYHLLFMAVHTLSEYDIVNDLFLFASNVFLIFFSGLLTVYVFCLWLIHN